MNLLAQTDRLFSKAEKKAQKHMELLWASNPDFFLSTNSIEYQKETTAKFFDGELSRLENEIIPRYFQLKKLLEDKKVICNDPTEKLSERHVFITLRPEENTCCLQTFMYHCEQFFKKNLFINSEWVFEQTGKTELEQGKGFHCHGIAIVKNYVAVKDIIKAYEFIPYNCILQIGRKDSKTKFITNERDLDYARNYIRGDKHNDEKEKAVIIDKIWREKNKINEIYN